MSDLGASSPPPHLPEVIGGVPEGFPERGPAKRGSGLPPSLWGARGVGGDIAVIPWAPHVVAALGREKIDGLRRAAPTDHRVESPSHRRTGGGRKQNEWREKRWVGTNPLLTHFARRGGGGGDADCFLDSLSRGSGRWPKIPSPNNKTNRGTYIIIFKEAGGGE